MESLWTWLNTPTGLADVFDPFGLVFAVVFAVGFVASAYLAGPGGLAFASNELESDAVHHWATVGLWTFGPGLFFIAMRALQINPLSFGEPIWLVGCVIALLGAVVRFAQWRRKRSPSTRQLPSNLLSAKQHPPRPSPWERGAGG